MWQEVREKFPEGALRKRPEGEEQNWVEEATGVSAAVKGPKFLEMLLGLPAKGPPSTSLPGCGFRGRLGRAG